MSEKDIYALRCRVEAMTDDERKDLDPVAYALEEYQAVDPNRRQGGRVVPSRIAALAAIDAMRDWERTIWEGEIT